MRTYGWKLKEDGYIEIHKGHEKWHESYTRYAEYVDKYLSPSVHHAQCGWDRCRLAVMVNQYGDVKEFIVLCADKDSEAGARWIDVSALNAGGMAEQTWKNIFN